MNIGSVTIIDKNIGKGIDLTYVNGKLMYVEQLVPSDWGD